MFFLSLLSHTVSLHNVRPTYCKHKYHRANLVTAGASAVDGDNEGETWYRVFLLGVRGSENSAEE